MFGNWLAVHGADPVRWAKRHGIEPFEHPCERCGSMLRTTVPIATADGLRGLAVPACSCGHQQRTYCMVHATKDLLRFLSEYQHA